MRYVLFLVAFCIGTAGASADDPSNQWKLIAGDGSVATSDCIGTYETVDCLADSIAACDAWTEMPPFTGDNDYRPAPICDEIPGYIDGGPFRSWAPKDSTLHLYKIDQWTLQRPEDWLLDYRDHANAVAGDTVLEFQAIDCSPDPQCVKKLAPLISAADIVARCPRTYCVDSLQIMEAEDEAGTKFLYQHPAVVFLIRQIDNQWQVIAWYTFNYYGAHGDLWIPDRWKR